MKKLVKLVEIVMDTTFMFAIMVCGMVMSVNLVFEIYSGTDVNVMIGTMISIPIILVCVGLMLLVDETAKCAKRN